MLSFISGKILVKREHYIIAVVNGLGYKIFVAPKLAQDLSGEVELYLYQQVKEDGTALFGFKTIGELEFFELLLTVAGIGPKSALAILSLAKIDEIKEAIALGKADLLTTVSGIGLKTAERLVVELKNKIGHLATGDSLGTDARGDELEALVSLGYSLNQAREALGQVNPEVVDSGERIRQALKLMARS